MTVNDVACKQISADIQKSAQLRCDVLRRIKESLRNDVNQA